MMKKIIPFLMAIFLVIPLMAQTYEVKLETLEDKTPGTYDIELSLLGFTDGDRPVGAITLFIEYDGNLLTYKSNTLHFVGALQFNPNFEGNSVIKLEWSNSGGFTMDDVFMTLKFDYTGGFDADLSFLLIGDYEIADTKATQFDPNEITFTNGGITATTDENDIDGTLQLVSQTAVINQTVIVPLRVLNANDFDDEAYAMDLQIAYDTGKLQYLGTQNNNLGFDYINEESGIISLQKSSSGKLDFSASTTLVELKFKYTSSGSAQVAFLPGSQVNGEQGDILSTRFLSGAVDIGLEIGELSISKEIAQCTEEIEEEPPFDPEPVPEAVSVEITADGLSDEDLGMITLNLFFDYEKLDYISFTANQFEGQWLQSFNPATGELIFIVSDEEAFSIADGLLLTLDFNYLCNVPEGEDGQADINFVTGTLLQRQAPDLGLILPELVDGFVNTGYELDVKVFLEGPYDDTEGKMETDPIYFSAIPTTQPYDMPPWDFSEPVTVQSIPAGVVDWILVELRDADAPANALPATQKWIGALFLMEDGSVVDLDGVSAPVVSIVPDDNIYIIIHHRNHIGIMSAVGMAISGGTLSYDFTIAEGQAYDGGVTVSPLQIELDTGIYGMFAGDYNKDGVISLTDVVAINGQRIITPPLQGYNQGDLFFNGVILLPDVLKANSNRLLNIFSRIP